MKSRKFNMRLLYTRIIKLQIAESAGHMRLNNCATLVQYRTRLDGLRMFECLKNFISIKLPSIDVIKPDAQDWSPLQIRIYGPR